jgi:hypothetical protein
MTTKWFGRKYPAPAYDDCPRVETPVGEACCHCHEPIEAGDDGWLYANGPAAHRECYIRAIVGSVAHQQKRCSCFGGTADHDEGITRRQDARAALEYWEAHGLRD